VIDPIDSLTFSLHSNKGAYAVLLGSGVSRAARIPTGWEVVEDLIRRLARIRGEECGPDPAAWYDRTFGEQPTYSGLLKVLARSPLERQQMMRGFFEPNEAEREQGVKAPTSAHRAIAKLVAAGHVRVILTTNFDRLTERAIEEVGIAPTVASSPDQIQGLPPLLQIPCLVVKLHGDYLDSRIKNTPEELAKYNRKLDRLLDRILDDFGLIVCGWSAQWDSALCSAIARCRSHRFTTYWAYRGQLAPEASHLISLRRAQSIEISDAGSFFDTLAGRIEALDEYDRPHPLSTRMAVETLKSYLVEPRHRIRLSDLMTQETEAAYERLFSPDHDPLSGVPYDGPHLLERMTKYEAGSERLQALLITGAAWGEPQHIGLWRRSLQRIATPPPPTPGVIYYDHWKRARGYPALRLLYASGLASIAAERFDNLRGLFDVPVPSEDSDRQVPIPVAIDTWRVADKTALNAGLGKRSVVPMTEYLLNDLREALREYLPSESAYNHSFDLFEYLLALFYLDTEPDNRWYPLGRFAWTTGRRDNVINRVSQDVERLGELWPPLQAGFFGGSVQQFKTTEQAMVDFLQKNRSHLW
jgi:hypothetical protein